MHVAAIILALIALDQTQVSPRTATLPPEAYLEAETLLAELGYGTGPVGDVWDDESAYADLDALRAATRPQAWEVGPPHIEVDLVRQVLLVVDADGTVARILPGGIAIHGSPSVPAHPASHGCIRVPMFAARELSEATPIGTPVIVGRGGPPPVSAAAGRTPP